MFGKGGQLSGGSPGASSRLGGGSVSHFPRPWTPILRNMDSAQRAWVWRPVVPCDLGQVPGLLQSSVPHLENVNTSSS